MGVGASVQDVCVALIIGLCSHVTLYLSFNPITCMTPHAPRSQSVYLSKLSWHCMS